MADDVVLDQTPAPNGAGHEPTASAPAAAAPAVDGRQLVAMLSDGIARAVAPIAAQVNRLEQQIAQPAKPAPAAPGGSDDYLDTFVKDPKSAMRDAAREWAREELSEYLKPIASFTQRSALESAKSKVVDRYGEAAWDDVYQERINYAIEQMPPPQRVSPDHIQAVVSMITGSDEVQAKLDEYRESNAKARKEAEAARRRPPTFLSGPGRQSERGIGGEPPTAEDQEFMRRVAAAGLPNSLGIAWDEAAFQKAQGLSHNMEERARQMGEKL